jgi:hypothetical protein
MQSVINEKTPTFSSGVFFLVAGSIEISNQIIYDFYQIAF